MALVNADIREGSERRSHWHGRISYHALEALGNCEDPIVELAVVVHLADTMDRQVCLRLSWLLRTT